MTGTIKELLKKYTPLADRYISEGSLEEQSGTYSIVPEGRDYVSRQYADGRCIRRMRFKVRGRLSEGRGEDIDNLRHMQRISDYLCSIEYPDQTIMGFEQISPPVMESRASNTAVYGFTAEAVYRMQNAKCRMQN